MIAATDSLAVSIPGPDTGGRISSTDKPLRQHDVLTPDIRRQTSGQDG